MHSKFENVFNNFNAIQETINDLNIEDKSYKKLIKNSNNNIAKVIRSVSKFARDIYYRDFSDDFSDNRFIIEDISCDKFDVLAKLIYKKNNSKENSDSIDAIIVIRGTKGFKNWCHNFTFGSKMFLRILFSLFLFLLPIISLIIYKYNLDIYSNIASLDRLKLIKIDILNQRDSLVYIIAGILLSLFKNSQCNNGFFHTGYDTCANSILAKLKSKKIGMRRLLIIGHSLSGGVTERLIEKISNDSLGNELNYNGVVFNSAASQFHKGKRILYIYYGMDIVTLINQIFIRQIQNKLHIEYILLTKHQLILKCILVFSIFILSIIYICNIDLTKYLIEIYYLILTFVLPYFYDVLKSSFLSNHQMNNIIEEFEN